MNKNNYSKEHKRYLTKVRLTTTGVIITQITILIAFLLLWEFLTKYGVLDRYLFSSPSLVWKTLKQMYHSGELLKHSLITLDETLQAFFLASTIGFSIAVILWCSEFLRRVLEPFIVVLNSLPKIALGPIIIVWMGAGTKAIVTMGILIVVIVTIINVLSAFLNADKNIIAVAKSLGANKFQIFTKIVLPSAIPDLISTLKINVGLSWIGSIMGEYLVSKAGLGYLLIYGGQVFNLNLVMTSVVILCLMAALMYFAVALLEKFIHKSRGQ